MTCFCCGIGIQPQDARERATSYRHPSGTLVTQTTFSCVACTRLGCEVMVAGGCKRPEREES